MTLPCTDSFQVIARLQNAWNTHDIEGLLACFHPEYESLHPCHLDRNFTGLVALRAGWCANFDSVPNFQADLKRCAVLGNNVWTEWHWHGCYASGIAYDSVGVMIFEVQDDKIARTTIYSEILTNEGPNWEDVLGELLDEQNDE